MARKHERKVIIDQVKLKNLIQPLYSSIDDFEKDIQSFYQGESAGVSHKKISTALQGKPITHRTAINIAKFLGIEVKDLVICPIDENDPTLIRKANVIIHIWKYKEWYPDDKRIQKILSDLLKDIDQITTADSVDINDWISSPIYPWR